MNSKLPRRIVTLLLMTALPVCAPAAPPGPAPTGASQGWCAEAAHKAREALARVPAADTKALSEALMAAGKAVALTGPPEEAAALFERAANLARGEISWHSSRAEKHRYIEALLHQGNVLYDQLRYEEAEIIYRRAVEAARITLPEKDEWVKTARNRYALALGQRKQLAPRLEFYVILKDSCLKAFGKRHEETAAVLDELITITLISRDLAKAQEFAEQSLNIRRKTLPANHPQLADAIVRLASVMYERGRRKDLEPLLKEALKIRAAAYGPDHSKTQWARENLALIGSTP
jgi:tetratricopeptide (TPR) repeat protein